MCCCLKSLGFIFKIFSFVGCCIFFGLLEFILLLSSFCTTTQIAISGLIFVLFVLSLQSIFSSNCCQCCAAKIISWISFLSFLIPAMAVSWVVSRNGVNEAFRNAKIVGAISRSMLVEKNYTPGFASRLDIVFTGLKLDTNHLFYGQGKVVGTNLLGLNVDAFNYNYLLCLYNEIFVFRDYFIENIKKNNPFIIECGGNIGIASLFFKKLYPEAKILSFEANKVNAEIFKKNIENNNFKNVTLVNKAVADKPGKLTFYEYGNATGSLIKNHESSENVTTVEVDAVLLSDYITEPVDLLKIDIEGAESGVLLELAAKGKLKLIKNIAMEYHYSVDDSNRLPEVLQALEQSGLKWWLGTTAKDVIGVGSRLTMVYASQK